MCPALAPDKVFVCLSWILCEFVGVHTTERKNGSSAYPLNEADDDLAR